MLLAAGLTTVDLLALDVEGIEYLVLHSLPWHLVDIKVSPTPPATQTDSK